MMSGQLPPDEQELAPVPPSKSPTLTAYGVVGHVPIPMLPAHGGIPAGARIVRPTPPVNGTSTPSAVIRRSGTPSAGPIGAFGHVAFAAPPGQLPRSLNGTDAAFAPIR